MSDYVKNKCIRLPIPEYALEEIKEKFNNDVWDWFKNIQQNSDANFGTVFPNFELAITIERYYIDYILFSSYGEDNGDYGFSCCLNDEEKEKYKKEFNKLGIKYNVDDLRKVVYCWYNGVEPPNYYEVSEDIFDKL